MAPGMEFRQLWEFRDGRSELSSDDSLPNSNEKTMQERGCPASQLPSPENDQGKDHSSKLKARKTCKPGFGKKKKVKADKTKVLPGFGNFGGMAGIFDISIWSELRAHTRSLLEDLDAERRKMSAWMREEVEKMSGNGAPPREQGNNHVPGRTSTRTIIGRKPMSADSKHEIGHDSIPINVRNILSRPGSRENPHGIIGSYGAAAAGISNEQSLTYPSPPNGFINYTGAIPRYAPPPILSNAASSAHPSTRTYGPVGGGQPMENIWIGLTNSMVSRLD